MTLVEINKEQILFYMCYILIHHSTCTLLMQNEKRKSKKDYIPLTQNSNTWTCMHYVLIYGWNLSRFISMESIQNGSESANNQRYSSILLKLCSEHSYGVLMNIFSLDTVALKGVLKVLHVFPISWAFLRGRELVITQVSLCWTVLTSSSVFYLMLVIWTLFVPIRYS